MFIVVYILYDRLGEYRDLQRDFETRDPAFVLFDQLRNDPMIGEARVRCGDLVLAEHRSELA